jgi:hypothetical protein
MNHLAYPGSQGAPTLLKDGDELEQKTWAELRDYIGLYEAIWQTFSAPLRCEGSIYFRDGIDPDLELLAMCNYTAFVNVARALKKIGDIADDLKFSEEIWANLQRAVEVGKKALDAFEKVYESCCERKLKIDRRQLESAEENIRQYRNRLHDPIAATIKEDSKIRLIPERDLLDKYDLWTKVMYHASREDFVTVEGQLRSDLWMVCQALQSAWAQMRDYGAELSSRRSFQAKLAAGVQSPLYEASPVNRMGASGTIVEAFGPQSIPHGKQ